MSEPPMWQPIIEQQRQEMFVGRKDQLKTFSDNYAGQIPKYMIFAITGEGGVGKSELLRQFTAIATSAEINGLAITCDDRFLSPVAVMGHVAEKLAEHVIKHKDFDDRYKEYRRLQQEVEADAKAPRSVVNLVAKGLSDFTVKNLRKTPGVGVFFESVDEKAAGDTIAEFVNYSINHFANKDEVQLLREPERILTPLFVDLLMEICKKRRLVLMFDVFERTCEALESWLLSLLKFEYGGFNVNLTFVVSGRDPLGQPWTHFAGKLCRLPLEPFSADETRQYLAARDITDKNLLTEIHETTAGLPVLVELLAATNPQPGLPLADISKDAVQRFLQWIPEKDHSTALLAAVPRQFNRDILTAALGEEAATPFNWLAAQSYIRTTTVRGRFYHDRVRELMLRYMQGTTPADLITAHVRLAQFFMAEQDKLGISGKAAFESESWCRLETERIYHLLSAQPEQNLTLAVETFLHALRWRWHRVRPIVDACRQVAREMHLATVSAAIAVLHEAFTAYARDEFATVVEKLTILKETKNLSPLALCHLYDRRGESYRAIEKYEEALADFNHAIELDDKDTRIIAARGETYRLMAKYGEALADFTRALELDDKYVGAYFIRGNTYRQMCKYDEALADFTRALEFADKSSWAYTNRGDTYLSIDRYDEALADFTRALELDDKSVGAYIMRGETYQLMGKYDEALSDFTRALELDDKSDWAYTNRGVTYLSMDRYDEALDDFTRALEFDDKSALTYIMRGETYQLTGKYAEALADFTRALELDDKSDWAYTNRGGMYQLMGKYEEALADFTHALELDDEDNWARTQRGDTYRLMEKYDEALADFTRVLELDGKYGWARSLRGQTYCLMAKYDKALADFTSAIELDDTNVYMFALRGVTYRLMAKYEEALTDLTHAIELDDTDDWWRYHRAQLHWLRGEPEQANADILTAIEQSSHQRAQDPLDWNNILNLALYYLAVDQFQSSEQLYHEAIDQNAPSNTIRDAINDLNDFLTMHPNHAQAQAMHVLLRLHLDERNKID
jgi:tetratricopeptide (TPR) repeat protein